MKTHPLCRSSLSHPVLRFSLTGILVGIAGSLLADPPTRNEAHHKHSTTASLPCSRIDPFFADEVWVKVGEMTCLKCHQSTGDASESEFILRPTTDRRIRLKRLGQNQAAFQRIAKQVE